MLFPDTVGLYWSLRKQAYSNILKIFPPKNENFQIKILIFFSYFCSKHRLWVLVRTASPGEAVLTSTHNLCFEQKLENNVYPCKPQFYYIKVGFKGVNII